MLKRLFTMILALLLLAGLVPVGVLGAEEDGITILFTHDIHDYLYPTQTEENGSLLSHGGAAKLATLLRENSDEDTLYLDAGDFSMGTLYQSAYATDAYELRTLGLCGCAVTTFGNHEFDFGAAGVADMLRSAAASGDPMPLIVQSNIDFSGELTEEQWELQQAFEDFGVRSTVVLERGGLKLGLFGVMGYDCIDCTQTALNYADYIEAAKTAAAALEAEGCDVIVALSHAGTGGDGGEDVDLARAVPDIDLIVSGHSHSMLSEPLTVGSTVIVSAKEYLTYLGKLRFHMENGTLRVDDYALLPIDETVPEDPELAELLAAWRESINKNYLAPEGITFDEVLCRSDFTMMGLNEMYASHQEFPVGNLIADAYLFAARASGIEDIDVALVGLGTIRSSVRAGDITAADAFEICSLGVGSDGSAGHPLIGAYVTGKELKLLTELDASLGGMVSSIKMSYAGLSFTFNTKRMLLDRVTDVALVRQDGSREEIRDDRLYKVAVNVYAANMLGMLNGLTKGLLSITPKNADGSPVTDPYAVTLRDVDGREIKEWVALKDYLLSFPEGEDGVPELPAAYAGPMGRKTAVSEGGFAVIAHPGTATKIIPAAFGTVALLLVLLVLLTVWLIRRRHRRKKEKKPELFREHFPHSAV